MFVVGELQRNQLAHSHAALDFGRKVVLGPDQGAAGIVEKVFGQAAQRSGSVCSGTCWVSNASGGPRVMLWRCIRRLR